MKNIAFIFCVLLSLSLLASTQSVQFSPYCDTDDYHHNSNVYVEKGETMHYLLDRYFTGFNLTYEFSDTIDGMPTSNVIEITQPVQKISYQNFSVNEVVGQSSFFTSDGSGSFVLLTNNASQKSFPEYTVWFGQGSLQHVPEFTKSIQLPMISGVECFDLTLVSKDIFLVDCTIYKGGVRPPIQNYYFLVNQSSISSLTEQQLNTYYGLSSINARKVMAYQSEKGSEFVVSAIFFNDLDDPQAANSTYINIYRYVTDPPQKQYPNGYLTYNKPIDYAALGISSGIFALADYTVFGTTIFALDFYEGVIMFQYAGGNPYNIRKINYATLNITHGWGISVNNDGGYIQLTIAGDHHLHSFHLDSLLADPVEINRYAIGFTLSARPEIQATDQYISLHLGLQVNIYKRWVTDPSLVTQIFTDVQLNQLFYSNTIFIYKPTGIFAYTIQRPTLDVTITDATSGVTRTIEALSIWYGMKYRCSIVVNTNRLDSGSQGIYYTNVQKTYDQNVYIFNKTAATFPLDQLYIGPNLNYQKFIGGGLKDPFDMILDIPHNVTVHMQNPQPDQWIFNRIIALGENLGTFYQLHQGKDLKLLIYECVTSDQDIQTVNCTDPSSIQLDSAIIAFSFGFFEKNFPVFALTTILNLQTVNFYNLAGIQQFQANLMENVQEIALQDNQMFIVTDKDTVDVWTYTDQIKLEYRISADTVASWPCGGKDWSPQRVITQPYINNTIFVRTKTLICVISIHQAPMYLNNIRLTNMVAAVTAYAFPSYLSIVIVYSDDRAVEYNLQTLNSIDMNTPMKQFNTYGRYNYINPVTASISKESGLLYILSQDTVTKHYVVLVYRTYSPQINTLYKVLDTEETTLNTDLPFDLHCGGTWQTDIVYVSINGKLLLLRVPRFPRAIITPNEDFPKYAYTARQNYSIQITGQDDTTQIQQEDLIFVNQQTSIIVDLEAVVASEFQNLQMLQNQSVSWDIDVTRWFFGPVMNLTLQCKDCGPLRTINLKNRIQYEKDVNIQNVKDAFWDHNTDKSYLLYNGSVNIYDGNLTLIQSVMLKIDPSIYDFCHTLIPGRGAQQIVFNYTFAICQTQQGGYIVAPALFQDNITAITPLTLDSISRFGQAEFRNGKLLVLNIDLNGQSAIYVYDIQNDIDAKRTSGTVLQIYNTSYPGFGSDFNITSFEIMPTDTLKINKIIITNYTKYVYILGVNTTDFSIISWDYVNVNLLLQNQNQFILSNTTLDGIKALYYEEVPDGNVTYLHYKVALITSNTAIYDFQLVFTSYNDDEPRILTSTVLQYVFQNYGNNKALRKMVQNGPNGEYLSIGYWNATSSTVSVVVYYRDSTPMTNTDNQIIPMRQIIGGVTYNAHRTGEVIPVPVYLFFYDTTGTPKLLTFNPSPDTNGQVFSANWQNMTISATRPDFKDQTITIVANSDYQGSSAPRVDGFIRAGTGPQPVECTPFCSTNQYLLNSNIYVEQNEILHYLLDDAFSGFNLTYDYSDNGASSSVNRETDITNAVKKVSSEPWSVSYILGGSRYINSSGDGYYSMLGNNGTQSEPLYDLYFGLAKINTAPYFNLVTNFPANNSIQCFDVANVSPFIMIVDCVLNMSTATPPVQNLMYIVNASDVKSVKSQIFNTFHAQSKNTARKTSEYFGPQQGKYVISPIFFDEVTDPVTGNETFLNIYQYVTDPPQPDYPNGYLTFTGPIDKVQLQLDYLAIADYCILYDTIYILDRYQGVISFTYDGAHAKNVKKYPYEALGISHGWAIAVNHDGGYTQMSIAGDSQLYVFRFDSLDNQPKLMYSYNLVSDLKGRADIQSTDSYITIKIGKEVAVYQKWYNDPSKTLYVLQNVAFYQLLYTQNLLAYNENGVVVYSIQRPSLDISVTSLQPDTDRTITATSTCRNQQFFCDIHLKQITLPSGSQGIFYTNVQKRDDQNVFIQNTTSRSFPLDQLHIGPNLQYLMGSSNVYAKKQIKHDNNKFLQNKEEESDDLESTFQLVLDIPQNTTVTMKGATPQSWLFNRVITNFNVPLAVYYQIHQGPDFKLYLYQCLNNDTSISTSHCDDPVIIQLKSAILAFTYGVWDQSSYQMVFTTFDQQDHIQMVGLSGQIFTPQNLNANITDLSIENEQLFVVTDQNTVQVWTWQYIDQFLIRFEIGADYVKDWPCGGADWTPTNVLTHHNIDNTVFVATKTLVCIVSVHTMPRYLNNIRYKNVVAKVRVHPYVTSNALVFLYSDDRIEEYSLLRISSPDVQVEMQQYPTYGIYSFASPLTATVSKRTGLVYVLATDTSNNAQKCVILVYRTSAPQINTLYKVIDTEETSIDPKYPITDIHTDGTPFTDITYVSFNGKLWLLRVPQQPRAIITPNEAFPVYRYTANQTYSIKINGMNKSATVLTEELILVNPQTSVILNHDRVDHSMVKNLVAKRQPQTSWDIDVSQWFFGPVMSLSLQCNDCGTHQPIHMVQRVQYKQDIAVSNVMDAFYDWINNKIYVLADGAVSEYDTNDLQLVAGPYALQIDESLWGFCHTLLGGHSAQIFNYTFAICQVQSYFIVAPLALEGKPTALKPIKLMEINNFGEAEFTNGKLVVLNVDLAGQSSIFVYDLINDINSQKDVGTVVQQFNSTFPKQFPFDFNISSFELMPTENKDVTKIFITNYTESLYVFDVNSSNNFQYIQMESVNLRDSIYENKMYITDDTKFLSMKVLFYETIPVPEDNSTLLHYRIAIITSNTAVYDFQLSFHSFRNEQQVFLNSTTLTYVFQNYGTNIPLRKFRSNGPNGEYLALGYWNNQTNTLAIAVYYRDLQIMKLDQQFQTIPLRQIIGGLEFQVQSVGNYVPQPVFLFYHDQFANTLLLAANPNRDTQPAVYSLNYQNVTIKTNGYNFKNQPFTIKSLGDYSQSADIVTGQISVEGINPGPNPPKPDDGGGLGGGAIAGIIIAILVVLGGAGFFFYKRRQKQLLEQSAKEDGYSLQEPLKVDDKV